MAVQLVGGRGKPVMFKVDIRGRERIVNNLHLNMRLFRRVGVKGVKEWADRVLADAIPLTPFESGELVESGRVREHPPRGGLVGYDVEFTADHAIPVHEINKRYTRGQWKYLETAWKASAPTAFEILRRQFHRIRALRRGKI